MGFKIDSSSDPLKAPSSHRLNNQKASIPSLETLKAKDFFKLIAKEAKAQVKLISSKDDVSDDSISDSSSSPPESPVTKQLEKDASLPAHKKIKEKKSKKQEVFKSDLSKEDLVVKELKSKFLKSSSPNIASTSAKELSHESEICPSRLSDETSDKPVEIGKIFIAEFKDQETLELIATEKAERSETVTMLMNGLETKIEMLTLKLQALQEIINPEPLISKKIATLQLMIQTAQADLSKYKKYIDGDITHASTNMARQAFEELGSTAKDELVPILCNLRMQTVYSSKGKLLSFVSRSGAISDFSHGEVSLQELKDFLDLQELSTSHSLPVTARHLSSLSSEKQARLTLQYLLKQNDIKDIVSEIKLKILVGYGVLSTTSETLSEEVANLIKSASKDPDSIKKRVLKEKNKKLLESVEIDPKKLESTIAVRRNHLQLLVLQDLMTHLITVPAKKNHLLYSRISLVDLNKEVIKEDSGCVLNEKTQGLDMLAILEEFDGKKINFDLKDGFSAFIDDENIIHMPVSCAEASVTSSTLTTAFFNICAQGPDEHVINKGLQKVINEDTLNKFKEKFGALNEFIALEESLKKLSKSSKNDPNDSILLASQFIQKIEGYCGINCFGGKDRTGYAVALMTFACIARLSKNPEKDLPKWGKALISDGIAMKIAKDNANQDALKLTRASLALYEQAGGFTRTKDMVKAAKSEIVKRARKQSFTTSKTPGQLNYKSRAESPTAIQQDSSPSSRRIEPLRKLSKSSTSTEDD